MLSSRIAGALALSFVLFAPSIGISVALDAPAKPAQAEPQAAPAPAEAPASAAPKTVLDGVFNQAQADRGKAVYAASCTICHGARLQGSPGGPGLAGTDFKADFMGATVGNIFDFAKSAMPPGRAGSLSDGKYVDVVAYILARNGYPTGEDELPPDSEYLGAIQIVELPKK